MTSYEEVSSVIVKKQISVIGSEKALAIAKSVKGLAIDSSGNVTSASKAALNSLVDGYVNIAGSVAKMIMKGAIAPLVRGSNIDLPESLK